MLGGSTAGSAAFGASTALANDGMSAFQTPFGYPAAIDSNQHHNIQHDECKMLEDEMSMNQITPSDQMRQRQNLILSGAIMKTQLTPLQNKRNSPESVITRHHMVGNDQNNHEI